MYKALWYSHTIIYQIEPGLLTVTTTTTIKGMQNQIQLSEPYGRFAIILDYFLSKGLYLEFSIKMTTFIGFTLSFLLESTKVQQISFILYRLPLSDDSIYSLPDKIGGCLKKIL